MKLTKEQAFIYYVNYANKELNCSTILEIDGTEYLLTGFKTFDAEGNEVFLTESQLKESFEQWLKANQ